MGKRRAGLSPHCVTEGPHGLHWVPEGMLGNMTISDLCAGTPVASVVKGGKRYEITDVEHISPTVVRFRYVNHNLIDYAAPHEVSVGIST